MDRNCGVSTGFSYEAMKLFPPTQPLLGLQRVPFISRARNYGHSAGLRGHKESPSMVVEHVYE